VKTIGDLERWLKGAVCAEGLDICFGPTRKVFYVKIKGVSVESASLEGALENALEELRRKDNGAESMRTEKIPSVTVSFTPPANAKNVQLSSAAFNSIVKSLGSIGPVSPPAPVVYMTCPKCGYGTLGFSNSSNGWACCNYACSNIWGIPPIVGTTYSLRGSAAAPEELWRYDGGVNWTRVP